MFFAIHVFSIFLLFLFKSLTIVRMAAKMLT